MTPRVTSACLVSFAVRGALPADLEAEDRQETGSEAAA